MDKILFEAEVSGENGSYAELSLPATDYELLDLLEQLSLSPNASPSYEILRYEGYQFLAPLMDEETDLYSLNGLARKLSELDSVESLSFEGLVQMEVEKKEGSLTIRKLIDLAYSADCCNYVPAYTDDDLGRFYAENDFLPELGNVPDEIYKLLDFGKIGKNIREGEGGVFTPRGYVVQTSDLAQVYDTMDFRPQKPDYVFRLTLGSADNEHTTVLELPADPDTLSNSMAELGLDLLEDAAIKDFDGVPLGLDLDLSRMGGLDSLNELARSVRALEEQGQLTRFKSILCAADCHDAEDALRFAEDVDAYILEVKEKSFEDLARDELKFMFPQDSWKQILPYVDLHGYGRELLADRNGVMTPYGAVQRRDCGVIHIPAGPQDTMEMR